MMADWKTSVDLALSLSRSSIEPLRKLGELNLSTWEKLLKQRMETFDLLIDTGAEQMQLSAQAGHNGELLSSQAGLACRFGKCVLDNGQQAIALGAEINRAYRAWIVCGVNSFLKSINGLSVNPA